MDEAWNRWDGLPDGRPEPASDDGALRLNRRSGSFREPPGIAASRSRAAAAPRDGRRPGRDGPEPLDQRLDRWVSRGRELVDGVAGARPGSRTPGPEGAGLGHRGPGAGGLNPARLGRWMEERFDWLLEDDADDDWREPWQEPARGTGRRPAGSARPPPRRRPHPGAPVSGPWPVRRRRLRSGGPASEPFPALFRRPAPRALPPLATLRLAARAALGLLPTGQRPGPMTTPSPCSAGNAHPPPRLLGR